jgi:hypothetical protein
VDSLAFWSLISLILQVLSIAGFIFVGRLQIREFQFKSPLQPLKRLLLASVVTLTISNFPIMYLHYLRIYGLPQPTSVVALATVANAAGMLLVATFLYMIYIFRGNGD